MVGMDLSAVADELYAAAPEEFMARRTSRAAEAKKAGDRPLATAIAQLRKPTRSAWLVNLLARGHPSELQSLLDLGAALREAQESLSGPDLRRLSAERHRVVDALTLQAAALGADHGHTATEASRQEVAQTLQAALADPGAAEVVRVGRVVQSISYGGFGTIDLGPVPAVAPAASSPPTPTKPATKAKPAKAAKATEAPTGDQQRRDQEREDRERRDRKRREAEQTLAAAQQGLAEAESAQQDAVTTSTEAEDAAARARDRLAALRAELTEAEDAERDAREHAKQTQRAVTDAAAVRTAAAEAVKQATARVRAAAAS